MTLSEYHAQEAQLYADYIRGKLLPSEVSRLLAKLRCEYLEQKAPPRPPLLTRTVSLA